MTLREETGRGDGVRKKERKRLPGGTIRTDAHIEQKTEKGLRGGFGLRGKRGVNTQFAPGRGFVPTD